MTAHEPGSSSSSTMLALSALDFASITPTGRRSSPGVLSFSTPRSTFGGFGDDMSELLIEPDALREYKYAFTFLHYLGKYGINYRGVVDFGDFLCDKKNEKKIRELWDACQSASASERGVNDKVIDEFLYQCAKEWFSYLQASDPDTYGELYMFEATDAQWQFYQTIMRNIIIMDHSDSKTATTTTTSKVITLKHVFECADTGFKAWLTRETVHFTKLRKLMSDRKN